MKQTLKKSMAIILATCMLLTATPLAGFIGLELPCIGIDLTADAETAGDYTYSVKNDEATITSYTGTATDLVIPAEIDGYPVTSIGHWAFHDCTSLTSVTIPDSVTIIEHWAFFDCTKLTDITVASGNAVYSSEDGVLFNKDKTELIQYPIGNARTSYIIPDSVTSIGKYAFYDCFALTSVTIPDSVTTIGEDAFYNTAYYNDENNWEDNVLYIGNHLIKADFYVPGITGAYFVKEGTKTIADHAFFGCEWLTSVTIPESVTHIGSFVFQIAQQLTTITVDAANVYYSSDEYGVLFNKDKTTLIQYPIGTTRTSYTIPDSVTNIEDSAFECLFTFDYATPDCCALTSVTIGNNVESIGAYAFSNCCLLTEITIPDKVTQIEGWTFYDCDSLSSVTIGDSVTSIGDYAFEACTALTEITIPDSVTSIGTEAFASCNSLKSVTLGNNLTNIGKDAFRSCDSLISIVIPNKVPSIEEGTFEDCISLTSVTIGNGVTSIGVHAFSNCSSLTEITIPDSVTSIGYYAFSDCVALTEIVIPDSVISIGGYAFEDCTSLTAITIQNPNCSIYYDGRTISSTATIYGYENSTAQSYANKYRRTFVALECDHTNSTFIPGTTATCTKIGKTDGAVCNVCKVTTGCEVIPMLKHPYNAVVTAPTCTADGFTTYTCTSCGDSYVGDYTDATGHTDADENGICDNCSTSLNNSSNFFAKLKNFFKSIIDFFKNLFGIN